MSMKRPQGLTSQQVAQSRAKHGNNVLTPPPQQSLWSLYCEKFNDPLIKILLVTLALSVGLAIYQLIYLDSGWKTLFEPLGILLAIVLATTVGFLVEVKANKKFEVLNQSNDDLPVKALRDGHVTQIPRRDVVVGDVVLLETGERIPADGHLVDSMRLSVDESSLTGEPHAWKSHQPDEKARKSATYPPDMVLRGSSVIEGYGVMEVTRVGDNTEYGQVATEAQIESGVKTPLMLQLDHLGRIIARASYVIAAIIVLGRIIAFVLDKDMATHSLLNVENAAYFIETIMLAVTLIVVSVPEGLPMSVTLSLALSMHRMLKSNNLVRRMHACETMGATTIICTDKTGTLTQNKMQVAATHWLDDFVQQQVINMSMACNSTALLDDSNPDNPVVLGNPTEGALLLWLHDQGVDYLNLRNSYQIESQLPFSTERKYMATVVRDSEGNRWLLVKGAPELLQEMCDNGQDLNSSTLEQYQRKAMRTLAFAYRPLNDSEPCDLNNPATLTPDVMRLSLIGFVAISDPVRSDVPAAITDCRNAGVAVKIVTGDNAHTAMEVARQVGIWDDAKDDEQSVVTGPNFAQMPDDEAAQCAKRLKILARARPADKARLVDLLQQQGEVVAVTGDGTNDAPALKKAQVGLSMGDGTHVAREASDITIIDNSFASINKAVLWGRSLYRNIQRFILFQLTVNVCACLVVAVCSFYSRQSPLSVTQMLWVNLIMDTFAALALASLPPNSIVMRVPPRRQGESIITPAMRTFIAFTGGLFATFMIGLFYVIIQHQVLGGQGSHFSPLVSKAELTVYFCIFIFLQFWNMFNAKAFGTGHTAFHNFKGSRMFFAVAAVILLGQVLIVRFGSDMFNVTWIGWKNLLLVFVITSPVMLIGVAVHFFKRAAQKIASSRNKS